MQELLNKYKIKIDYNIILNEWNSNIRYYHTQNHLLDLINQINENKNSLSEKEYEKLILCSLFHDIVYDPTKSNNEEKSASFFINCCQDKTNPDVLEIKQMILDTKTHEAKTKLSEIFNKFDMNIVERDYNSLLEWESGIYEEYKFAGDKYKNGRLQFLESLLNKYPENMGNLLKLIDYVKTNY